MHRGDRVWRVGKRDPLGCVFWRFLPDGEVELRGGLFARLSIVKPTADVFADRAACAAEISRRRENGNG